MRRVRESTAHDRGRRIRTLYWACTIICMPKMNIMMPLTWTCVATRCDANLELTPRRHGHHHVVLGGEAHLVQGSHRFIYTFI